MAVDRAPEREILVSRRQGHGPDAFAAEDRLHPGGRAPRSHDHAPDRVGVDPHRHEHEAIAELCPQSLAQHIDDRLLRRVEDERDRLELEGFDLALVELCELGDEWKQAAKWLDVARQDGQLGLELLDLARPAARPAA